MPMRIAGPAALCLVLLLAGCAMPIQAGTRTGDQPPFPGGETLRPPTPAGHHDGRAMRDEICRVRPTPSGWIRVAYATGARAYPPSTRPDDPYTVAVIERYSQRPTGFTMVVCADQSVPRGWVLERSDDVAEACPGARVPDDSPTAVVIRRVR